MKCLSCGNEFPPSITKPSTFCSPKCRLRHHRLQKRINPQPISQSLAEPQPSTPTKLALTQAEIDQQALEDYRRSPAYKLRFPPNTTFLPFNHAIPHFRGLAVPDGMNPEAYLPIQPKLYFGAKNQPSKSIQAIKDSLTKPL